jgi:hypothetical protein
LKLNAISASGKLKDIYLYQLLNPSAFTILIIKKGMAEVMAENYKLSSPMAVYQISPASDLFRTEFDSIFGDQPAFILIRPDSYVAVCGLIEDQELMNEWI